MKKFLKLKKLQSTFSKLTESNQFYVLGLAEGLKQSQGGGLKELHQKSDAVFKEGSYNALTSKKY